MARTNTPRDGEKVTEEQNSHGSVPVGTVEAQGFIGGGGDPTQLETVAHNFDREQNWVELAAGVCGDDVLLYLSVADALELAAKLRSAAKYLEADAESVDAAEEIDAATSQLHQLNETLLRLKADMGRGESE